MAHLLFLCFNYTKDMAEESKNSYLFLLAPLLAVAVLLIAGFFIWQGYLAQAPQPNQTLCTQDVKQCPDGSYVSRTGEKCEFAACPATPGVETYTNSQYGFSLELPDAWKGYSVLTQTWQGRTVATGKVEFEGPQIVIRNPQWKQDKPWQDVPVMVFTKAEWNLIEQEKISLGAAPIGPSKLGENQNYVFALPARWYGFTDAQGQDEAVAITKTFKAF